MTARVFRRRFRGWKRKAFYSWIWQGVFVPLGLPVCIFVVLTHVLTQRPLVNWSELVSLFLMTFSILSLKDIRGTLAHGILQVWAVLGAVLFTCSALEKSIPINHNFVIVFASVALVLLIMLSTGVKVYELVVLDVLSHSLVMDFLGVDAQNLERLVARGTIPPSQYQFSASQIIASLEEGDH